ncbi:hypothetical protein SIN8267_03545 [Sinobacterium norvegicum]|uniref:N-acetyltransferase domain-containing protein n=1 Tax=Sinobacterium norvegicum TaxID=1641715 RepID=A0ABM9AJH9_9GAMM|nr:GNAT family N-acetyltransferase [Sinobacterium norvegicum]CAH0993396.1 hypothetical protein SIN8267_03545 [Sinobacterium norvegicum]
MTTADVRHQPQQQRFFIAVDSHIAVLEYTLDGDNHCDFCRTYVPFSMRGKGYAELLATAAVSWATEQGYALTASCWYVEKFLAESAGQ